MILPPQKHGAKISSSDAGVDARTMPILVRSSTLNASSRWTRDLDPVHTFAVGLTALNGTRLMTLNGAAIILANACGKTYPNE